jgi:hypothetical protein
MIIYDIGSKKVGIYHTDGRYVEDRSDICWNASLVELWYNDANDLSRGVILDLENQSEYIPRVLKRYLILAMKNSCSVADEEFMLSSIDEDDSDSCLPHNFPQDHCQYNVRAMLHYELFPSSTGHTDSMIDMMNSLHDDDKAQNDKPCRDTDYSDEMDLYVNDFMMSMHHDLVLPVAPKSMHCQKIILTEICGLKLSRKR